MAEARKYGWIPDYPDHRDRKFSFSLAELETPLPESVDLTSQMPPVFDQGQLGSCVSNATCEAMIFCEMKKNTNYKTVLSRLFQYYNARDEEGNVDSDSGSSVRTGIKVANRLGICIEEDWAYNVRKFKDKPADAAYTNALFQRAIGYESLNNDLNSMKRCLASGFPFVGGISIYESFESEQVAKTGIVPMPSRDESSLGGHCVLWIGFDNKTKTFKVRNSWGPNWGDNGNFYLPYEYVLNLADDLWVIKTAN